MPSRVCTTPSAAKAHQLLGEADQETSGALRQVRRLTA
jgi:hypothetical protein